MEGRSKLDARTRHMLSRTDAADAGRPVSVFVQFEHPPDEAQLSRLKADGAAIQAVAGDVLTAEVPLDKVAGLAEHDFVRRVEASAPLRGEGAASMPPLADVE